jgi:transcriptional regulator with XRE-family HTH domain
MAGNKGTSTVFGKRLRETRLLAGMPQDKLGVAIGLDETVASARISRYETGQHEPPYQTAQHLATVLSIPVAYLYCDGDDLVEIRLQICSASDERIREIKLALNEPS